MLTIPFSPLSEPVQLLLLGPYLLISAVVTVHVLFEKNDVRAALGWIGLTWLSPFLGAALYFLFGINRVTRRASQFDKLERERGTGDGPAGLPAASESIIALSKISERVTGSPLTGGNSVDILHGGDEAYPAMLAAIREAHRSIALASYIFRNDEVGGAFIEALVEAHRRGVEVRVLLDGIGSGYFRYETTRRLHAAGIPNARFLHTWVPWRMPFLNMRNHKKLLIVDGVVAFSGGLNIAAAYSARLSPGKYVQDVHMRVEGPVTRQLMDTFARDWAFTTEEVLDEKIWWPEHEPKGTVCVRGVNSGPDADLDKLEIILGAALAQARRRVRIVTPYFLPDQRLEFALAQARLRGVSVEILIPERTDYRLMDWAVRAHLRFFSDTPMDVFLNPPPFDHSKLMTVDGEWSLIGSSNWDARSLRLNFEFDLECYDAALTAEIDALIDRKMARSYPLPYKDLVSKPKWIQVRDASVRLLLPYL
jgi:cardiolipin synthase